MLTTVIFDMDGLLIDSEPLWGEAMKEVFAGMDIHLTPHHYAQTTGLRTSEVVDHWYHVFKWKSKSALEVTDEILENVTDKILKQGVAMKGLEYILEFFKEKDFKMGLASSSPMKLIQTILTHLGISAYFDAIHSAEHEDFGKPHPAVYLACAAELDSLPIECLVFEDSLNGLIAAKAARMKVVAVPEAHRRDDPRYVLADLKLDSLDEFGEEELEELDG